MIARIIVVQELHFVRVQDDTFKLLGGLKCSIGYRSPSNVPQTQSHVRRTTADFLMLEFHNLKQNILDPQHPTTTQLACINHFKSFNSFTFYQNSHFADCVNTSTQSSPTTTRSSIRTPPHPATYIPGSTEVTAPTGSLPSFRGETVGAS